MKRIKNFVKNTFKNYPKDERERLIKSITEMLVEKVEDLVENGLTIDEAIDRTVTEFGDIDDFDDSKKPKKRFRIKNLSHYRNDIVFSVFAILIIIGMLAYVNLYFTDVIWFVIPALALLFWPLSTIYRYLNRRGTEKENKDD